MTVEKKRIFIGGLFPSINETDLRERFSHFGTVSNIEIKTKKGDNDTPKKTFAYLDITASEQNVKKCLTLFNKTKWKGQELKLEEAKESFLTRLEAERQKIEKQASQGSQTSSPNYSDNHVIRPLDNIPGVKDYAMKGAKPGTPIPGEKNWIVGKYRRILPIVYVRKKDRRKIMKVDPSKFTHNLKMLKPEQNEEDAGIINPDSLTWKLDDTEDTELSRKRKGIFPEFKSKHKIQKHLDTGSLQTRKSDDSDFEIVTMKPKKKLLKHNSSSAMVDFDKDVMDKSTAEDVDEDSYSSADTDEIISMSKKTKGDLNKSNIDCSRSFTTSTPNSLTNGIELKSNLKPICLVDSIKLNSVFKSNVSVALNAQMQNKDNEKSGNMDSFSNKLKNYENGVVSTLSNAVESFTKVKDLKTNKSGTKIPDSENERKMPIMQEFKGTKSLYDKDTMSVLSAKVKEKGDAHIFSGTACNNVSAIKSSKLIPEFPISVQNSALRRKDNSDSDHCSVKSDDTDEIVNLSKKARKVYSPLLDKSIPSSQKNSRPTLVLTDRTFVDEFSSGFVDMSSRQNVSEVEDTDDEESDFEAFAKKELQKFETSRRGETSVCNKGHLAEKEIVKSKSKEKASFSLITKSDKDTQVVHPLKPGRDPQSVNNTVENTNVMPRERKMESKKDTLFEKNKIMEVERKHKIVEKQQDKERNQDNNNGHILKVKTNDETQHVMKKDDNDVQILLKQMSDDQKRLETVKRKQKEFEAQKMLIKKALSSIDQSSCGNKKIVFGSDSEVENCDVDNVKKLRSEASMLVSGKLQSHTSLSDDPNSDPSQSNAEKRKSGDPSFESESDSDSESDSNSESDSDRESDCPKSVNQKELIRPHEEHCTSASEIESDGDSSDSEISHSDENHGHEEIECDNDSSDSTAGLSSQEETENSDSSDSNMARSSFDDDVETVAERMKINHAKPKQIGSQKVSLFDHSSDAESDEDEEAAKRDQDMFRLRPEFEGETGKKLMKLQSRYGNDPRFRLDKRFKESDSDNEMLKENDEEDETTKSLKILRDVLGDKANIKVTAEERKKNIFKDVTVLHFDPTREDHKHYEIKKLEGTQKEMQSKKKKKKMKQDSQHQDEGEEKKNSEPSVGKDKFYQVSSSLIEAFSNKGNSTQSDNTGFSLLAMFGSKKDDDKQTRQDHSDVLDQEKTNKALKIKTPYLWEHFGGDDDGVRDNSDADDDIDEKSNKAIQEESNKQDIIPVTSAGSKTFFIAKDDERLKDAAKFCRRESLEIIRKKWEEQRPLLVEMYKTRYKQQRRKSRNGMKPRRF
ncbi:hypothetical protein ACJMK2_016637 [Sinanodonta woodiana]|uniref:RRM domain-containing protein n=1 Tax=Sinanodonta woodiana TaxID=1069815 RepID=A0ABD3UUD2_SINWO